MSDDAVVVTHVLKYKADYYALFGVSRDASTDDIKRAYKRLALRLHPDKNKHARAEEAFKVVGTANGVLTDPAKRSAYDRGGESGVQQHEQRSTGGGGGFAGHPFAGGAHYARYGQRGAHVFGGGDDIFEEIFSMFMGGGPRQQQQQHFFRHQQQQQQQQQEQFARQRQQQQQQQHQYEQQRRRQQPQQRGETEMVGTGLLSLLPFLLFVLLAFTLQSGILADASPAQAASASARGGQQQQQHASANSNNFFNSRSGGDRHSLFSLVSEPRSGFVVERVTTQLKDDWLEKHSVDGSSSAAELRVTYFVPNDFEYLLRRNRMSLRMVEAEVAKSKKESLERRCFADQEIAAASKKKLRVSAACKELEAFRRLRF